jgi:hypothetical protein
VLSHFGKETDKAQALQRICNRRLCSAPAVPCLHRTGKREIPKRDTNGVEQVPSSLMCMILSTSSLARYNASRLDDKLAAVRLIRRASMRRNGNGYGYLYGYGMGYSYG